MQRISEILWPAAIALLVAGLFLACAGLFLLALQYRRHGRLSWRRTITSGIVVLYAFGLFSYTMLPMPTTRGGACRPGVDKTQLVPLRFIDDFQVALQAGERAFVTSFSLWQVLLNVLLFIPVGILAVRWARANVLTGTLLAAALSLLIEATQFTGTWGLYTCPYRVSDIDDLLTNTTGALLGTLLAYLPVFAFLAGPDEPRAGLMPPRAVSRARRLLADVFDLAFITAGALVVALALEVLQRLGLGERPTGQLQALLAAAAVLCVAVLPVLAPGRASLGQRCAWIGLRTPDGRRAGAGRALLRALLGVGGIYLAGTLLGLLPQGQPAQGQPALYTYAVLSAAWLLLDDSARGLSARATRTRFADRRA